MITGILASAFTIPLLLATVSEATYCSPGNPCWPTPEEIAQLTNQLSPTAKRALTNVHGKPLTDPTIFVCPAETAGQPFCGYAMDLKPVYVNTNLEYQCDTVNAILKSEFCILSARNLPRIGQPAFIVW